MAPGLIIWSNKRNGHHADYALFLASIAGVDLVEKRSIFSKIISLVQCRRIIILDFEYSDWFLYFLIWSRAWLKRIDILSVHGELYESKITLRAQILRLLLRLRHRKLRTISIHRRTKLLALYFDDFILDPQLLDASFIEQWALEKCTREYVKGRPKKPVVVILGRWNDRRNYEELDTLFKAHAKICFLVIADNAPEINYSNVKVEKRYLSRKELFEIYETYDYFLFKYNNKSPSGFVGRAIQFGKHIIIPSGSYLDIYYEGYGISKSYLEDLGSLDLLGSSGVLSCDFHSLRELRKVLGL